MSVKSPLDDPIMASLRAGQHISSSSMLLINLELGILVFSASLNSDATPSVWSDARILSAGNLGSASGGAFLFLPLPLVEWRGLLKDVWPYINVFVGSVSSPFVCERCCCNSLAWHGDKFDAALLS